MDNEQEYLIYKAAAFHALVTADAARQGSDIQRMLSNGSIHPELLGEQGQHMELMAHNLALGAVGGEL